MTCPQACAGVPVEKNVVAPERITLELLPRTKNWAPLFMSFMPQEDTAQPSRYFL